MRTVIMRTGGVAVQIVRRCVGVFLTVVLAGAGGGEAHQDADDDAEIRERVMAILAETPLIDGHNDTPWQYRERVRNHVDEIDFHDTTNLDPPMVTDLARLREGGVGGQFWSVFIPAGLGGGQPGDVRIVLEQIDLVKRLAAQYPDDLEIALTADDVERIHAGGRVASMMGMEGGHSIENSLASLRALYDAGARYMTLAHGRNTLWADSATDQPVNDGLTEFGREVVREMNRIGMLVDLSHVSPATMHDALDVAEAPVIFSHSSARALCDHVRNVPDDVLKRLPDNGGVVMVCFLIFYVSEDARLWAEARQAEEARLRKLYPDPDDAERIREELERWQEVHPMTNATLAQVADHIEHIREVAGIDHIGIGSDYDGMPPGPDGLEDVSCFPALFVELLRRDYSDEDIAKIAGRNILRVMRGCEEAAGRLQLARPPSDALLEELDGPTGRD